MIHRAPNRIRPGLNLWGDGEIVLAWPPWVRLYIRLARRGKVSAEIAWRDIELPDEIIGRRHVRDWHAIEVSWA